MLLVSLINANSYLKLLCAIIALWLIDVSVLMDDSGSRWYKKADKLNLLRGDKLKI